MREKMQDKRYSLVESLEELRSQVIFEELDADRRLKSAELERTSSTARSAELGASIFKKIPKLVKFLPKAVGNLAKSTIMAIPVVDVVVGSMFITSILARMKSINDRMALMLDLDGESFARYILAGSNADYNSLLSKVANLSESDRQQLREDFESVLYNIKQLVLTIVQAYDTVAAAVPAAGAGAVSGGAGAVATEAGANLTTSILGFLGSVMPVERFLFELSGSIEEGIAFILGAFFKSDPGKLGEIKEKGGPLAYYVLLQYVTFDPNKKPLYRLYRFYSLLKREGEISYLEQGAEAAAQAMLPIEQMPEFDSETQIVAEAYDLKRWKKLSGLS